jgi:phage replication O-like protein O
MDLKRIETKGGFMQVPHSLSMELMRTKFGEHEHRVIWAIARSLYGYADKMLSQWSINRIAQEADLDRSNTKKAIQRLVDRNILWRTEERHTARYAFIHPKCWDREDWEWGNVYKKDDLTVKMLIKDRDLLYDQGAGDVFADIVAAIVEFARWRGLEYVALFFDTDPEDHIKKPKPYIVPYPLPESGVKHAIIFLDLDSALNSIRIEGQTRLHFQGFSDYQSMYYAVGEWDANKEPKIPREELFPHQHKKED